MWARLSDAAIKKLHAQFPASDCARVEQLLLRYGSEDHHREIERVRVDILEICDSSLEQVEQLVNLACSDYRDLIVAAEYQWIDGKLVLERKIAERKASGNE